MRIGDNDDPQDVGTLFRQFLDVQLLWCAARCWYEQYSWFGWAPSAHSPADEAIPQACRQRRQPSEKSHGTASQTTFTAFAARLCRHRVLKQSGQSSRHLNL